MKPDRLGPPVEPPVRPYPEDPPTTRTEFQRDRDRVLYSSALLRLGHVTQVTAPEAGRVFHTRLTHSLKVAQVARRIAEMFVAKDPTLSAELDPDAVEAAALAHDLGHPPFGHIAEEELHAASCEAGGFEGNAQSFRIVTKLALRDGESADGPYKGLNLTFKVLNGIIKYPVVGEARYEPDAAVPKLAAYFSEKEIFAEARDADGFSPGSNEVSPIAKLMDWADDVTYAVHDIEDFFRAGVLPLWTLANDQDSLDKFVAYHTRRHPNVDEATVRDFTKELVDPLTSPFAVQDDGSSRARAALRQAGSNYIGRYVSGTKVVNDAQGVRIKILPQFRVEVDVLKSLIWFFVIENAPLATVQHGQRKAIRGLHSWHLKLAENPTDWRHFPPRYQEWLREAEPRDDAQRHYCRIVTDYIASATEAQAMALYRRMGGYSDSSPFDGTVS